MRLSERWAMAPTVPPTILTAAGAAIAGAQFVCESIRPLSKRRRMIAKAAALVATAMKVVTGVGAPWYTSGVQVWNGATEALKASPASARAMPVSSSGSSAATFEPIADTIVDRFVLLVAP